MAKDKVAIKKTTEKSDADNLSVNPDADQSGITKDKILGHMKELLKQTEPIPHNTVLFQLTEKIKPIDYRTLAELSDKEHPKNNHYQIITVENIIKIARQNKWDLCQNNDFIYVYNGAFWSLLSSDDLKSFLGNAAEKMGVDKFKARFYNFRDQLYKQFLATANLPKPVTPENAVRINLENGTFEITPDGNNLKPFNCKDFITYQLPFNYDPKAIAPKFEAYLNRVLPDINRQKILAEYLGYVFMKHGTLKLEKALLLYGSGANGKSVFFEIVNALLGSENVSTYSLKSLTNDDGYYRAMLANKLVNYASEIGVNLETSIFKQLVSGEKVEARLPYGAPFLIDNYGKLIFNCNELPWDVEHTLAFFRRFLIIPFDITIPEEEQDKQLASKIIAHELSGVFNWVLDGLNRLLEQKNFTECEAVKQQLEQYRKQSDSVLMFIEDYNYINNPDDYTPLRDLYSSYRSFCFDDGLKPVSKHKFSLRLTCSGYIVEKKNIGNVVFVTRQLDNF
ncbi:MAG: phage/plasmid primase, P4 family [Bacteroidales bacterium]|jgi:putative DNA primase/helicase|nr:phage/plasmid primase, P4 family [Bacteroidales bacterium]